jgi:hypothetical protein
MNRWLLTFRTFSKKERNNEMKRKFKNARTKREKWTKEGRTCTFKAASSDAPFYPILTHLTGLYTFSQPNELMSCHHLLLRFPVGIYPKVFALECFIPSLFYILATHPANRNPLHVTVLTTPDAVRWSHGTTCFTSDNTPCLMNLHQTALSL